VIRLLPFLFWALAFAGTGPSQPPQRDRAAGNVDGTAVISGRVVTDEERPQPVRRAIVTLTGAGLVPSRGAITDDEGRFRIEGLPEGRFALTATRASFITSAYGAKRPARPGTPIVVSRGATLTDIEVRLWRGAALEGIVRTETGAPAEGVRVRAVPVKAGSKANVLTLTNNGALTDARGRFRVFGLEPGVYVVAATPPATTTSSITAPTEAEVDAILERLRRPAATNRTETAEAASVPRLPAFDFAPVFFPGTHIAEQATAITLAPGQARTGLDITLRRVPTVEVAGAVSLPEGGPAIGAVVQMTAVTPTGGVQFGEPRRFSVTAGADGTFSLLRVTPGDYELVARVRPPLRRDAPSGGVPVLGPPTLWASARVVVTDQSISGVSLVLTPGLTFSGQLRFQSLSSETPTRPPSMPALGVAMQPPTTTPLDPRAQLWVSPEGSLVGPGGEFVITGYRPGAAYQLFVSGVPSGWWPHTALMEGRDLLDKPARFAHDDDGKAIVVTFIDQQTEVSGELRTTSGAPISDVFVIAFSTNRALWGEVSRRIVAVRPDIDGRYTITGLPAGEYFLGAVTDVDEGDTRDASLLDALSRAAIPIHLALGDRKIQHLTLGVR